MAEQPKPDQPKATQEKQPGTGKGNGEPAAQNPQPGTATVAAAELDDLRKRAGEREEYLDLVKRTQAEFQNYQKRVQRDREQERLYYAGAFVQDLLPVMDNLERAITAAKQAGETGPLVQGVNLVLTQFLDLLKKFGVTPIVADGQPFDPNLHEALTQQPSADHPPNTVIHVAEKGYKIHDRVLRPSKVVVSSAVE